MGHYAKRFFGKEIEEPRDPDFVFTVNCNKGQIYQWDYIVAFGWSGSFRLEIVGTGIVRNYSGTGSVTYQGDAIKFPGPGTFQVRISGQYNRLSFRGDSYSSYVTSVDNWGNNVWKSTEMMFQSCSRLKILAEDIPNISQVTNFKGMFWGCSTTPMYLGDWNITGLRADLLIGGTGYGDNFDINERGTTTNYDNTLIAWSKQEALPARSIQIENSKYSQLGKIGRDILEAKGWTFIDGGMI